MSSDYPNSQRYPVWSSVDISFVYPEKLDSQHRKSLDFDALSASKSITNLLTVGPVSLKHKPLWHLTTCGTFGQAALVHMLSLAQAPF